MDNIQRFLFENGYVRGEIAHIEASYQQIIAQRKYPPMVQQLLGEALVSCLLLTASIKFEGQLSLQFKGDSRLPLILVQCDHHLNLRACAKFEEALSDNAYTDAFLNGQMVITINQYNQTQPWQSLLPLLSISMATNLMYYFAQSEQIPTSIWLAVNEKKASGMLIQRMPCQNEEASDPFWEYAMQMGQTIKNDELLNLDNEVLLHRLYHESELRLFPARSLRFQCSCSLEKMQQALQVMGETEVKELLAEKGVIEVNCEFCNTCYSFSGDDIDLIHWG